MAVTMVTSGIHHLALRVLDYDRSKRFYTETLGFPIALEKGGILIFMAGGTPVSIRGPAEASPKNDVFNPLRTGLDHVALACGDKSELQRVADALTEAGVENTGIKMDETLGKEYVAFKDPDRISWEFYMA